MYTNNILLLFSTYKQEKVPWNVTEGQLMVRMVLELARVCHLYNTSSY
jgi:hypothetical protein